MGADAVTSALDATPPLHQTTVGRKAIMAVSGIVLFGFVLGHMAGNLLVFAGPDRLNAYAALLRSSPALLWGARALLLAAVVAHVAVSIQLALLNRAARPIPYAKRAHLQPGYAARTMLWSGPILLAFVIYHLLHFTFGSAHPAFRELDVYHNVVAGFRVVPVSLAYIAAMLMLGLHLKHGLWSMFQSLGIHHPRLTPALERLAAAAATLLVLGNTSIPLAVILGWIG